MDSSINEKISAYYQTIVYNYDFFPDIVYTVWMLSLYNNKQKCYSVETINNRLVQIFNNKYGWIYFLYKNTIPRLYESKN